MRPIKRFFTDSPIVFPLLAVFLVLLTIYEIGLFWTDTMSSPLYYGRPLVHLLYSFFWIASVRFKKWGGIGFIGTTGVIISIYHLSKDLQWVSIIGEVLYKPLPLNILLCILILSYYKRFQ